MLVKIKRLTETAKIPTRGSDEAAAYDVYADESAVIWRGKWKTIRTGFAIEPPDCFCTLVLPRSGLGVKKGVGIINSVGLIDNDYRGEIKVGLINHGREKFEVKKGDRIAQIMLIPYYAIDWSEEDLSDTARGRGGFGSTGK